MKILITILLIIFSSIKVFSQIDTSDLIDEKLFQLLEGALENNDDNSFYDIIDELRSDPIDINSATKTDLLKIPFINSAEVSLIINYRKKRGGFRTLEELKAIKNIHPDIIMLIKPFLYISDYNNKSENNSHLFSAHVRSRIINDIQDRAGFINNKFSGDKVKSYNRIKIKYSNYNLGFLAEKDAGEKSYIDHYTGFLQYKGNGFLKNIVVGDYNLEFGEGLAIWGPYAFSKGADAVNGPKRRARLILPTISSEENLFFRGAAIELDYNSYSLSAFYSLKNIDATINEFGEITNFNVSGYHRTTSELSKKNNIREIVYGISTKYNYRKILNLALIHFSTILNKPFTFLNRNELHGSTFYFSSLNYNMFLKNIMLDGELSYNNDSFAFINNLEFSLTNNINILTSYRNYSPSYFNLFANGFGEYSNTQNESGYYLGTKIRTSFGTINIYYDIFNSPSKSFRSSFPSTGSDMLINYKYKLLPNTTINLKFKNEVKELKFNNETDEYIKNEVKSNYRCDLNYNLSKHFSGKTRLEYIKYSIAGISEDGYLTYQQLKFWLPNKISIVTRLILFDTDSFNSRIYEFENDLKGVMSNIPMFYEGLRWYLLVNFQPFENLNVNFKYSESYKPNSTSFSSGNTEIIGNIDNRISFQLEYSIH